MSDKREEARSLEDQAREILDRAAELKKQAQIEEDAKTTLIPLKVGGEVVFREVTVGAARTLMDQNVLSLEGASVEELVELLKKKGVKEIELEFSSASHEQTEGKADPKAKPGKRGWARRNLWPTKKVD